MCMLILKIYIKRKQKIYLIDETMLMNEPIYDERQTNKILSQFTCFYLRCLAISILNM